MTGTESGIGGEETSSDGGKEPPPTGYSPRPHANGTKQKTNNHLIERSWREWETICSRKVFSRRFVIRDRPQIKLLLDSLNALQTLTEYHSLLTWQW